MYDYNYYIAKYPEVLNKVGYDDQKVLNYFVEQGMAQHQQASAEFDPVSYRFGTAMPSLQQGLRRYLGRLL